MNQFLLGGLSAIATALAIEAEFLSGEDEDAHVRLDKLIKALEKVVGDLVTDKPSTSESDSR